jgi:hypothetical protein
MAESRGSPVKSKKPGFVVRFILSHFKGEKEKGAELIKDSAPFFKYRRCGLIAVILI